MKLVDRPLSGLLDAFASADPTPGGGSAAALAGAVGTALLLMVCRLPRTRSGSDETRAVLDGSVNPLAALREELLHHVDRDSAAYEAVVTAYRLPKTSDTEQTFRRDAIQAALRGATEVPLQVMRNCVAALARARIVAVHGSPSAASDVAVAVELLRAGLRGARLNVETNLGSVASAEYVQRIRAEMERLADEGELAAAALTGSGAASGPTASG